MSSWPLVKYVDSPATTATVRYDFNDQAATPAKKVTDFDPGVPALEGDPDAVGQQWGFRSASITHTVKGTKAQAMAQLSLVSREQLRRNNWVLFQPSAGVQPVWFKTYRTGYEPITLDRVYVRVDGGGSAPLPDTWKIVVPLVADAFAYGARQTISTITFEQTTPADLTAGRSALTAVLPAIKGDAPTKLRLIVSPAAGTTGASNIEWLVGCVSSSAALADPVVNIGGADAFSAPVGTSLSVTNAAYLEGNYRALTISPNDGGTGKSYAQRFQGNPALTLRGRYKVLLRCEADSPSGVKTYLLGLNGATSVAWTVGVSGGGASTSQGWVDLGDFTFPTGVNAPADGPGTISSFFPIVVWAGTADNTAGTVRADALKFIPIDGPTVTGATLNRVVFPTAFSALYAAVWDGDTEVAWVNDDTGVIQSGSPQMRGAFPVVDPLAAQNLLVVMATKASLAAAGSTGYVTSRKAVATAVASYYPRYLHIGDGT